jgi:hexosaminidase
MDIASLLPLPRTLVPSGGTWTLAPTATISAPPQARVAAHAARDLLGSATGYDLPVVDGEGQITLALDPDPGEHGPEAYRLSVAPSGVTISAPAVAGLLNGLQTLRQLLPADILRPAPVAGIVWSAPCVVIDDYPEFAWRGVHLDVSRHFFPVDFLHHLVEVIALHKLNVLHLHLTDDQGWRFPSERYPRLTEISSWRSGTNIGFRGADGLEPTPHGGYYTKDELADLVAHAAQRNVDIVPEIDLPGHTQAVLAAYPELGNGTGPYEVRTTWGISTQVLSLEDNAVEFCKTILAEVMELFPSRYIHVGGDEVPKDEWRASAAAQVHKADLGLADEDQLQHWFTSQLSDAVRAGGRTMVGWDEILEGGEPPVGAVVMSWRGVEGGIAAAKAGRDVVMCPNRPLYLDYYQSESPDEPLAIGSLNTLADICSYHPVPPELDEEAGRRVLGSQVELWTEYMPNRDAVEYMAFPRTTAFADVTWGAPADPADRLARVEAHLPRLDALTVNYRPPAGPHPWQQGGTGRRARPAGH